MLRSLSFIGTENPSRLKFVIALGEPHLLRRDQLCDGAGRGIFIKYDAEARKDAKIAKK
ncbi:MAG: hypothetical protein ACREP8_16680 [Candidatus Binatia bacterium]